MQFTVPLMILLHLLPISNPAGPWIVWVVSVSEKVRARDQKKLVWFHLQLQVASAGNKRPTPLTLCCQAASETLANCASLARTYCSQMHSLTWQVGALTHTAVGQNPKPSSLVG